MTEAATAAAPAATVVPPAARRPWPLRWPLTPGPWMRIVAVLVLLCLAESVLVQRFLADQPARATLWFWTSVFELVLWIVLAPGILALVRRFPVDLRDRSWRNLLLHVGFSLAYGVVECAFRALAQLLVMSDELATIFPGGMREFFSRQLVSFLMVEAMVYWSIVVVAQWWTSDRRRRDAEVEAANARMLAVQQSLAPHFTLNALNALVAMLPESSREQRFAIAIGGFMNDLLVASRTATHGFSGEMAMVERYLAVERERLGARLDLRVFVEPGLDEVEVPVLALQPLFENAVRYAVAPFRNGGRIDFRARRVRREVLLQLESEASEPFRELHGSGHGEAGARTRFELLYGPRVRFHSGRDGSTRYSLTIAIVDA